MASDPESVGPEELSRLRLERDYYRQVAEQTGKKALADFVEMSRLIVALRGTQAALRQAGDELERKVEERTADVVNVNAELRAEIRERTRAEREARESAEMYRLLTETSPDAITVVDGSGTVLMVNQQALDLYEHSHTSEVVGRSVFDWVAPEEHERALGAFGTVLAGAVLRGLELKLLRKSGEMFWASTNASLVRDAQGAPRFAILVTTDITARKRAESELLKTQKLESLGVLAGGIAHDFNNLLTAILGNISFGLELAGTEPELRECLVEAERASQRARELTKQLLTFSRGGQPVKKPLAIGKVLDEAVTFGLRGAAVRSEAELPDGLWTVEADEGQLAQVVNNLVINAVQAMPSGGTLRVRAENVVLAGGELPQLGAGRYVRVTLADTGMGIPREHWARIFDPYFTTKQKGSGLGLAVAYSVVTNHGGTIEVDSVLGQGAAFTIHLPACEPPPAPSAPSERPAPSGRQTRVLVMDDEKAVRDVTARLLKALGCTTVTAKDGEEAIAEYGKAQADGAPFELVIMDLTIPGGMGGLEAIHEILALDPAAKAIVSSGYSSDPVLSEYAKHGFRGVLPKPYRLDDLRAALVAVGGGPGARG